MKISGTDFIRENKKHLPNVSRNVCDYFCRLMIYSYADGTERLTPASLYKTKSSDINESAKKVKGLITFGRYTSWKSSFMESGFANYLGVSTKIYWVENIEKLLDYPSICILLLYEYLFKEHSDEEVLSLILNKTHLCKPIEKILKTYSDNKERTELFDIEKYDICFLIFSTRVCIDTHSYIYTRNRVKSNENEINEDNIKSLLHNLKNSGKELYIKYEQGEEKIFDRREKSNFDDRPFEFSPYLAPIVAAICEYFSEEKYFEEMKLWKTKKIYKKLEKNWFSQDCTEMMCDEFSKNLSLLLHYMKSTQESHDTSINSEFLVKYYYLTGLMLQKINCIENKVLVYDHKIIQYYVAEQLMKMELIEKEAEIIYKNIKEMQGKKKSEINVCLFLKKNKFLKKALRHFAEFEGTITRIGLAEQTIQKYFDRKIAKTGNRVKPKKRTFRTIIYESYLYHIHKQLFLENLFIENTKNSGTHCINRGELLNRKVLSCDENTDYTYLEQTKIFLNKSIALSKTLKDRKSARKFAKEKTAEFDDMKRSILIFVITQNFFKPVPTEFANKFEESKEDIEKYKEYAEEI